MVSRSKKTFGLAVLLSGAVLLLAGSIAATRNRDGQADDDRCIRCHVEIYRKVLDSPQKHRPSFEGRCVVCHLAPQSIRNISAEKTVPVTMTGVPVAEQGNQWRKSLFFVGEGMQKHHVVTLPGLPENKKYRFRIVEGDSPKSASGKEEASQWLGLIPVEVPDSSAMADQDAGPEALGPGTKSKPVLQRLGKTVVVSWQSPVLRYGRVELQEITGIDLPQPGAEKRAGVQATAPSDTEPHPVLLSADLAAIDQCYTCHPASSLGTSHPVRVYATGKNTRIPASLPTVKNGMMTCATCHDPHGSPGKGLVREEIVTKLCVACHYNFNRSSKNTMF